MRVVAKSWAGTVASPPLKLPEKKNFFCGLKKWVQLKELYTSESTLAQEIVLTPLNNEFKLKNLNSTSFMLKSPPKYLNKIYKIQI